MICLEDQCKGNRLLCLTCLFESHRFHNTAIINSEIASPVKTLKMHSSDPDFIGKYDFLEVKQQNIADVLMYKIFIVMRKRIGNGNFNHQPFEKQSTMVDFCFPKNS